MDRSPVRVAEGDILLACLRQGRHHGNHGRDGTPSVTVHDLAGRRYHRAAHAEGEQEITITLPIDGARPVTLSPRALVEF